VLNAGSFVPQIIPIFERNKIITRNVCNRNISPVAVKNWIERLKKETFAG